MSEIFVSTAVRFSLDEAKFQQNLVEVVELVVVFFLCKMLLILYRLTLTVVDENEQTEKLNSLTKLTINKKSLRSRNTGECSKKALSVEKPTMPSTSTAESELLPDVKATRTLRSKPVALPQQTSTRSSSRNNSESALDTVTSVKSVQGQMPALNSASRLCSPESRASASGLEMSHMAQTVQDGDGSNDKTIQASRSASTPASSPITSRSRTGTSSSPAKDTGKSDGLPWASRPSIATYQRKHVSSKTRPEDKLQSTVNIDAYLSDVAAVNSKLRHSPRKEDKIDVSGSSTSQTISGEEQQRGSNQHDVAVQASSQSLASSLQSLEERNLHSTPPSLASSPLRLRYRNKPVMESSSSTKTAMTAKSSTQYDTCVESGSSQQPDTEDVDDDELDRLARLAHGSPPSAVVPPSHDDTSTDRLPKKSHGVRRKHHSSTSRECLPHASTSNGENTNVVVVDGLDQSFDSDESSPAKKRRTQTKGKESSRNSSDLAADGVKNTVKHVSRRGDKAAASASSEHLGDLDRSLRSRVELSSSQVKKSSTEPVAGPSGMALRTRIQQKSSKKLRETGMN